MIVRFYIERKDRKSGENVIFADFTTEKGRVRITTGYKISGDKWDVLRRQVKRNATNREGITAATINTFLDRVRLHFGPMDTRSQDITEDFIRKEFSKLTNAPVRERKKKKKDVLLMVRMIEEFINVEGTRNGWAEGTIRKFHTLQLRLKTFKSDMTNKDFTPETLDAFIRDLVKRNYNNNYILKLYKLTRRFHGWALKKKYVADFTWEKPTLTVPKKDIIFLNVQEVKQLADLKLAPSMAHLEKTKDLFLFQCYTGLRFSDAVGLTYNNLVGDELHLTTRKDADRIIIPLFPQALAIIKKYEHELKVFNRLLPDINNVTANKNLKTLCGLAEINTPMNVTTLHGGNRVIKENPKYKFITTHCARRTFVCFALKNGIPPTTVMRITGHSDYNAMQPYIAITEATVRDAMSKLAKELK